MSLDPRPAPRPALHRAARAGLLVGIPLALLLGAAGISRAFDATSGWAPGETLTAADLNGLLARLNGLVGSVTTQGSSVDALTARVSALEAQVASLKAEVTLPFGPEFVTSTSDQQTDLGDQIQALIAQHRNVRLRLARNTATAPAEYRWNTPVWLAAGARLVVEGAGYVNGATDLGVKILMTTSPERIEQTDPPSHRRVPARLVAKERSWFELVGVVLEESGTSGLPLTLSCTESALFGVGEQAVVSLSQSRITSTENLVNPADRALGRVLFGHTWISRNGEGRKVPILPVAKYNGWCWWGGGAIVSNPEPHTHLVDPSFAVTWDRSPNLTYLPY